MSRRRDNLDLQFRLPSLDDRSIDNRRVDDARTKDERFANHLNRQKRRGGAFDWRRIETRVPQPCEHKVRVYVVAPRHL